MGKAHWLIFVKRRFLFVGAAILFCRNHIMKIPSKSMTEAQFDILIEYLYSLYILGCLAVSLSFVKWIVEQFHRGSGL